MCIFLTYRYIWETNPSESKPTPRPVGPAIYGYISNIAAYSSQQHIHGEEVVIRRH